LVDITNRTRIDYADLMKQVIRLAERGRGHTGVNPLVGALVLDRQGDPVGSGYHARLGGAHAETVALEAAGARALGGTLVVNLEPCCHSGRTGPCTRAVIAAGIARVVIAHRDPDRRVAGRGVAELTAAGIEVEEGVGISLALRLNEHYLTFKQLDRPFVTLKLALSLDGFVADREARSQWITGPACRAHVHGQRARHDAVLVGAGTALSDNPQLTVRDAQGPSPRRFVLQGHRTLPPTLRLFTEGKPAVRIGTPEGGADWSLHPDKQGHPDLDEVMRELARAGVSSILVEGGPTLAGALLQHDLVDKVMFYYGPVILGSGVPAFRGWERSLEAAPKLIEPKLEALADGFVVTGYLRRGDLCSQD
jgi:diaminohydroxyphosphoribosylaminopyrimidine deaminase/5-amino-6-(5-phosphoribosylamino)uracil reductase